MGGTILENLSAKKLSILVSTLLVCLVACFLLGGLIGEVVELAILGVPSMCTQARQTVVNIIINFHQH